MKACQTQHSRPMSKKFIISGGGTGGHIFPALSIAGEIKKRLPDASILFVGALGRMEMEKVPAAGYPIVGLPVEGLQRKISFHNVVVLLKLLKSLWKARKVLKSFRPDTVIGVGGYASGPLLRMANWMRIPTLIQEQNSYAGVTNRLLAGKVRRICVAYSGMEKYFPAEKIVLTGNPVREAVVSGHPDRVSALRSFGFEPDRPVLLVLGGSLGARTINESVLKGIQQLVGEGMQVLWQTGKLYHRQMLDALSPDAPPQIRCVDFINHMERAYAAADLIVSRAGAGTISELCLVGKPVILVPSPNVAEDHQTKNARALVEQQAAVMVTDREAPEKLISEIRSLMKDEERRTSLGLHCRAMGLPGSAAMIVDEIFKIGSGD
jgi:UDP-N-acetylglucosamine--N-acetylmuramyl-(pentapeptide) pyrophosphoryl-undecaprenol N-acetylglucosamine transferase